MPSKHILLLCKQCLSWRSFYHETELTLLLRLEDFSLSYEEEEGHSVGTQLFIDNTICFQNTTAPKEKGVYIEEILRHSQADDYIVSPKAMKNVKVEGGFGCCGMLGDLEENPSFNVFCVNGHPIGIETSECDVFVHYTRIPAENVEILLFEDD